MQRGKTEATSARRESSALNWLRALFAFLVLVGHVRQQFLVPYGEIRAHDIDLFVRGIYFATGFGSAAVVGFFVLSGYLITRHYHQLLLTGAMTPPAFLLNRAVRIYMVLVPVLLGSWLLVSLAPLHQEASLRGFFAALLLLQPLNIGAFAGNSPLWSLGYEAWCYFAFCGLVGGVGLVRRGARGRGIVWGILGLAPFAFFSVWMTHYFLLWALGAGAAVAGARVSECSDGRGSHRVFGWLAGSCAVAGFMAARFGLPSVARDYAVAVPLAATLALMQRATGRRESLLDRLAAKLARFSYSLYLTHYPFVLLFGVFWGRGHQPSAKVLSLAAAACLVCVLFALTFSAHTERHTNAVRAFLGKKLGL